MPDFTVKIDLKNVAEGDATSLAQDIWDAHAEEFDARLGDFEISISRFGFPFPWEPMEAA